MVLKLDSKHHSAFPEAALTIATTPALIASGSGPGTEYRGQAGVIPVPEIDPAPRWRNRRLSEGERSSPRQPGRWSSSTSIYPLTMGGAVRWDGAGEGSPRPPERPFAGS